ncbi:MAG TPA: DUF5995 family protein, partial [Anaerolineae bacterium]|nr:DUF5995 family protein [Anaerolineae bacterium]
MNGQHWYDDFKFLEDLITQSQQTDDPKGYFATLYYLSLIGLQQALENDIFTHPQWVDKLHQTFFQRYVNAVNQFNQDQPISKVWKIAFKASQSGWPTVDQHLMLGMNAHINYDLGIAVADSLTREQLPLFKRDFVFFNQVLLSTSKHVRHSLGQIAPPLRLFNQIWDE